MLHNYIVTVDKTNGDLFYTSLNSLSINSEYSPGARVQSIIPFGGGQTVFRVNLTLDEAVMLSLLCPGKYDVYTDDKLAEVNRTFWKEHRFGSLDP